MKKNGLKSSDFFSEFVDSLAIGKGLLLIVGDFNTEVSLKKLPVSTKTISFYRYKLIDEDVFLADLKTTFLVLDPPEYLFQMVDLYNSTLMDLIEKYAPLRSKQMP